MHYSSLKVILIPGNGGSSVNDHWFPYAKQCLQTLNLNVVARNFPDPYLARAKYWLPFLENELKADKNTILVGHSSGGVAALRYAETHPIYASIIIGANHTHLNDPHEKQSGYFDKSWGWDSIRANQKWIGQFASVDDPYIPIQEARHINKMTTSEYYEYQDKGHFGEDTDMNEFPELIQLLRYKLRI